MAHKIDLAEEWAQSAITRYKLSAPIDVHKVRKGLGLCIRKLDLKDGSGCIITTPKRHYVVVNKQDGPERQRFSIAHEIAEFLLLRYDEKHGRHLVQGKLRERFCDRFAVCLLMPAELLKAAAVEVFHNKQSNDKTLALAHMFGVSAQAMSFRLWELGINRKVRSRRRHDPELMAANMEFQLRMDAYAQELLAEMGSRPLVEKIA